MVSAVETPNFKMSQDAFACVVEALNILDRADYTKGLDQCVGQLQRRLKMPRPSRTCASGASSKAAYYLFIISLPLKNFLTALICYQSCEVNISLALRLMGSDSSDLQATVKASCLRVFARICGVIWENT